MNWIKDAVDEIKKLEKIDYDRRESLIIRKDEDIPQDLSCYRSVSFLHDYVGSGISETIRRIVEDATEIRRLFINCSIDVEQLRQIDFSKIEDLFIRVSGDPRYIPLKMDSIKKLEIAADGIKSTYIKGSSGKLSLISLKVSDRDDYDLNGLSHVSTLKKLSLSYIGITDLDWLDEAKYQLDSLYINDCIMDCEGIINQRNLRDLSIHRGIMLDVSPLIDLQGLEYLDLRRSSLLNEAEIRNSKIKKKIISEYDRLLLTIDNEARSLSSDAGGFIYRQNKRIEEIKTGSIKVEDLNFHQRFLLKSVSEKTFDQRVFDAIKIVYKSKKRSIMEGKPKSSLMTKEDYLKTYVEKAEYYYPFLKEIEPGAIET